MKKFGVTRLGGRSVEMGGNPMPAKSAKQKRFMDAAAHNPAFAKKVGIPSKVAKEFSSESKGMTFRKGGEMKESKEMMKKEVAFMKKKGAPKSMVKHEMKEAGMKSGGRIASKGEHSVQTKSKRGAEMIKMAKGGLTKSEVKKADAAGRKVTRDLKYDDMKDRMMKMRKGGSCK